MAAEQGIEVVLVYSAKDAQMKVDRSKLKKSSSEVPADCKAIIDTIKGLSNDDLLKELKEIKVWTFGKCELYHWADVLDVFDAILEKACSKETDKKWTLCCDLPGKEQLKQLLMEVLRFTALLIEHSFSRHLYNSMDHLTTLLTSCDMSAVLYVLNLLYVFSKRSNFISRMSQEKKQGLVQRLVHLAESWGGKENGFGLAECCQDLPAESYPPSATTLHFEFYVENKDEKSKKPSINSSNAIQSIHIEHVDQCGRTPSQLMEDILTASDVPEEKQIVLFTHIRLACLFSNYEARVHCVQARLQAISILVYSSAIQENMNVILYPGLIEELVDIVEIKVPALVDIRSAALRTLTSVIHIERNPRLISIIDATGASSYHGFLPVLVRTCIQHMIDPGLKPFPQTYATSLFSFLYHLANYENGVEALVVCGMMESLLKVINWYGDGQEHITFVTRAVRVIDLITNMDMAAFQGLGGLQAFINRLEHEVNICREEQPFVITPLNSDSEAGVVPMDVSMTQSQNSMGGEWPEVDSAEVVVRVSAPMDVTPGASSSSEGESTSTGSIPNSKKNKHCFAQRAALLKSMLNFMKKAIPDMSFAESIRHLMDGSLPRSLKHIVSNAEYYGPSLFLLATDVVTVYVFQEPSLLSSLQDKGLTDVVLHALLVKDVPATREVLASLPNVFSALCLNARGLQAFVACRPFERLFKVLLSPDYLPAMRRRRSSDPFDTASNLGTAMDELMRHQPSLRTDATKAIIKLLEEISSMGMDPHFICQKQQPKNEAATQSSVRSPQSNEASSSDEEEEEEVEMPHMPPSITGSTHLNVSHVPKATTSQESMQVSERQAIPLMDYVLNVMKFVEAILSNNSTDDHCREFVQQKGLKPLMSILGLPNLPIDFPSSPACQAVSSVCKSILSLSREPQVLKQGLLQMNEVLQQLQPLHMPLEAPGGSVLLRELANCAHVPDATLSPTVTPLLHALAAAHAYIMMFVQICRMGQTDIRTISLNHWGSDLGLEVLKGLSSLYNSLVWESTVLLALCNEDYLPADCQFGKADLEKLLSKDAREKGEAGEGGEVTADDARSSSGQPNDLLTNTTTEMQAQPQPQGNGVSTGDEEGMDTSEASPEALAMGASSPSQDERQQTLASQQQGASRTSLQVEGAQQSLNLPGITASSSSASLDFDVASASIQPPGAQQGQGRAAGGSGTSNGTEKDPKKKVSPAMHAQLRQLKPLLTLSSRLGRALSELFVLLVKLSVGSPVRQRRSQQPPPTPPIPSPAARAVALALTKLLAGGLSFQPPAASPQPKLRMTFLVCSAGFTAPMLFDEKKQPYHLMLQKFVACGGQAALFQSFSWALSIDGKVPLSEGLEHPDLPEGTGEFLDSWLSLVEKMINPKAVLETPHMLPSKGKAPGLTPFSPVQYLISTQKAAFNAVMNLWNKAPLSVNGSRISESVLAILCHIICGETILKKYIEKDKAAAASGSGDTAVDLSGAGPSNVVMPGTSTNSVAGGAATSLRLLEQPGHLSQFAQLIDMGFTREQALEALTNTDTLEQATDYILTHSIPSTAPGGGGGGGGGGGSMDVEMDDHNQIMMAIAMSLGENAVMSTDQPKTEIKEEKTSAETEEKQEAEEPLDTAVLDDFTLHIFPGCLKLIDALPETVYRICDLLVVCMHRNGLQWKKDILESICKDLCELCMEMTEHARKNDLKEMLSSDNAKKFATRLHLLSLLAEEMNRLCAVAMHQANLPMMMVVLLQVSKMALLSPTTEECKLELTPKWLAPMLLLLDLWEKIAVSIKRKINARVIVGRNRKWKWFDDSSGRWNSYAPNNNATIDEAYKKGDSFVRFQTGRKKYCIQFGTMIQRNEDSGNRRPVMLSVPTVEDKSQSNKEPSRSASEDVADDTKKEFEVSGCLDDFLPGLSQDSISTIVSCLSSFLSIQLLPDSLHAAMRLILRVTRQHQYAVQFVSDGGAQRLLTLTQESNFQGFLNLATLIFRHILEEPVSLRYCMEKVMRNVCAGAVDSCQCGVSQNGVGAKEMHYILRVLGPAACRDPELFSKVARDTLQIVLPPVTSREEDEARYLGPNAPQILKCTPTKQLESLVNPWIKTFIWDLLTALASSPKSKGSKDEPSNSSKESQTLNTLAEVLQEFVSEATGQSANSSNNFWPNNSAAVAAATAASATTTNATTPAAASDRETAAANEKETTAASGDNASNAVPKPLIPKSAILRLLSEIIRSYGNCVHLITQHAYQPGQSDLITETCSVLAFVLDNLLPIGQEVGDKDCPILSRVFIASIASCSHSPDAQLALVTEVKGALQRALTLPEGVAKHQRIQALAAIISTMIESCPTPGQMPNQFLKVHHMTNNNMMKILVKKGALVDLARVPHSLDLSSPFLAATVNAVLRPLETLSRSVNSPDKFVAVKKGGTGAGDQSSAPDQGGTTTQVVTEPAIQEESAEGEATTTSDGTQMNVTIEDVTNNLEAQQDVEVTSDNHIAEPESVTQECELDHVLSQIFQSGASGNPEDQVLSEMTISQEPATGEDENEILIDVEVEGDDDDYEHEHHDSQMVSQVLSDEEDGEDGDNDRDHDNQDDVSGDDEDYDEADQEEMGEDDDDEDDEDEDDEDDEEASDLDGEGDDYQEIRNPFDMDDLMFHMEDFPSRGRHLLFNEETTGIRSYQLPMHLTDNDGTPDAMPSLPPAPSLITSTHPLLMRQSDSTSQRGYRGSRSRIRSFPAFHVTTRQPNTPLILQRLLGPSTAAEILTLTSTLSSQNAGASAPTRVVVAGDNLPFLQRGEDDFVVEDIFQDTFTDTSSSGTGALSCIPSTHTRWSEETKVLDGDGVHDLVTVLKPPLVEEMMRKRDEELSERKDKRKQKLAEISLAAESSLAELDKKNGKGEKSEAASSSQEPEPATVACPSSSAGAISSTQAEWLASAMVEQVLSPMVSSSSQPTSSSIVPGLPIPSLPTSSSSLTSAQILAELQRATASAMPLVSATATTTVTSAPTLENLLVVPLPVNPSSSAGQVHPPASSSSALNPPPTGGAPSVSLSPFGGLTMTTTGSLTGSVPSPAVGSGFASALADLSSLGSGGLVGTGLPPTADSLQLSNVWDQAFVLAQNETTSTGAAPSTIMATTRHGNNPLRPAPMTTSTRGGSGSGHNSMISQLLDSIMVDTVGGGGGSGGVIGGAGSGSSNSSSSTTLPSASSSSGQLQTSQATNLPFMFVRQQQDGQGEGGSSLFRYAMEQNQTHPLQFGSSLLSTTATSSAAVTSANRTPVTIVTTAGTSPTLFQLPLDGAGAVNSSQFASSTMQSSNDLDLCQLFLQPYSSGGVTGATPPLSNLSFITTTASAPAVTSTPSVTADIPSTSASEHNSERSADTDPDVPEGVDPSFLAALPDHIRQEVIAEQLRLQRIRRRAEEQALVVQQTASASNSESTSAMEVNPEFLAALPPAIQEEVLAQQRAEQARMAAQQQSTTNPDAPVDLTTFFSTLSSTLRRQVLSDMDDSMLAVLPPELAAEAQEMRLYMERHRSMLQERLFAQTSATSLSGLAGRLGSRFAIRAAQRQNQWSFNSGRLQQGTSGSNSLGKVKGRFMLDPEALTCLLVLLFIDEPKLNTTRLHRVLRNLCYHAPTRGWLMKALLSIIQRAGEHSSGSTSGSSLSLIGNALCLEEKASASGAKDKGKGKKSSNVTATSSSTTSMDSSTLSMQSDTNLPGVGSTASSVAVAAALGQQGRASTSGFWLSISLEAALGCRANVFQIQRAPGKKLTSSNSAAISIHPQAAPVVCKHALETLISLAKIFPYHFLPASKGSAIASKSAGSSGGEVLAAPKEDDQASESLAAAAKKSSSSSTNSSSSSSSSTTTTAGASTASQSSPKNPGKSQEVPAASSSTAAGLQPRPEAAATSTTASRPENDFWNILVRLDNASGKSKGKGVQRNHNLGSTESEPAATDYSASPIGQLMSMLSHPVIHRSQVLTDRLLRLLSLVSTNLPNRSSSNPISSAATRTTAALPMLAPASGTASSVTASLQSAIAATAASITPTTANTGTSTSSLTGATAATTVPVPQQESGETKVDEKPGLATIHEEDGPIMTEELRLAVEVLTSKACSEDGLEDATGLLIQLASVNHATCTTILSLLLDGACKLGLMVCGLIGKLLDQLVEFNRLHASESSSAGSTGSSAEEESGSGGQGQAVAKGIIQDRFSSHTSVVVTAPTTIKTGRELQLSSMSPLTCKTSCQQFFLRILKVIIQLRAIAGPSGGSKRKPNRASGHSVVQHINDIISNMLNDSSVLNVMPAATGPLSASAELTQQTSSSSSSSGAMAPDLAPDAPHVPPIVANDSAEAPMEVDPAAPGPSSKSDEKSAPASEVPPLPRLSEQLGLDELWNTLGDCLAELARTSDHHAVLILQPTVEAFFLVHAGEKASKQSDQPSTRREDQLAHLNMEMAPPSPAPAGTIESSNSMVSKDAAGVPAGGISHLPPDTQKFLKFAETHRPVLNQILRQSTLPLADGPFSVLVDHTRILDFDVKRRYFRQELERMHEGSRREDLPVHVRRSHVFEDSFRELFRRPPEEWKQRFFIVFEGEEGQDAGGLLREWYVIISHEIFNQNYALFLTSPGDRVTYSINPSSHCNSNHLSYFKFVGRIIAKAVYDNKLLDCYFTRSFYKHMLGLQVKYTDMESEDYDFYRGLHFLLENSVSNMGYDIFFSTEIQEFGVTETRELMSNGSNVTVTEENKREYVKLVCQMKMTGAIRQQLNAFLEGFYDIIPKKLVSIFTEQELELLISGLPTIDIDNLKANTEYNKYQATSLQIQWFWRALRSFDQAERANFLQFVTGTSKVPLGGFSNLEGMNGVQCFQIHRDDRSTDRLPSAHTCFNQLDLPAYETYDKLRKMLLLAISECSEGFGLA